MPRELAPPVIPAVSMETEDLKLDAAQLEKAYALALVTETYDHYEWFRQQNHDSRWNNNDALYFGWVPQKLWEGTKIPRASQSTRIVYDKVETALPAIIQALFGSADWFQVAPGPGVEPQVTRDIEDHYNFLLNHDQNEFGFTVQNELEIAIKDILLHGNGFIGLEWEPIKQRTVVKWVDLRNIYIDPGASLPSVDSSRSIIERVDKTIDELAAMRSDKRMDIPSNEILYHMSKNRTFTPGDMTKQVSEQLRGVSYTPGVSNNSPMPAEKTIEVLIYTSKSRIIWVLNRQWVAYIGPNPYGFLPYCSAPCSIVPGRFYAEGFADVQEDIQKYMDGLWNGRLDELSLAISPPRTMKRGVLLTASQQKWRPGALYPINEASDMQMLQPQSSLTNIYPEMSYLESMSDKRVGVNSLGAGVPKPSNANRTGTGMQMQLAGSNSRLQILVKHIEDYLIVPMLYKIHKITKYHSQSGRLLSAIDQTNKFRLVQGGNFSNDVKFKIFASSKMLTRDKVMSVFPFIMQYVMQGPVMQELKGLGKTVDFAEITQMLQDATGIGSKYNIIRDMNPQEQQAAQQLPPEVMMEQQKAQQDGQIRLQMGQMKAQSEIQKAMIMKQPDPPDPGEQEMVKMKLMSEQMMTQIKAAAAKEEARIKLLAKQQELVLKRQESQQKLQASSQEHAQKLQQNQQQGILDQIMGNMRGSTEMKRGEESHRLKLQQSQEMNAEKVKAARKMRAAKPKTTAKKK